MGEEGGTRYFKSAKIIHLWWKSEHFMLSLIACHQAVLIRSNSPGMIDIKEGNRGEGGHITKRGR